MEFCKYVSEEVFLPLSVFICSPASVQRFLVKTYRRKQIWSLCSCSFYSYFRGRKLQAAAGLCSWVIDIVNLTRTLHILLNEILLVFSVEYHRISTNPKVQNDLLCKLE